MPSSIDDSTVVDKQSLNSRAPESRIDLLTILAILAKTRRRVVLFTLGGFGVGVALSVLTAPTYIATAIILPPQQSSSSAAMLGQMGGFSGAANLGSSMLGLKSPADMYVGILESRTVADNVIAACHLSEHYKTHTLMDARAALQAHTTFESGKDDLIHVAVKDGDPKVASTIANSYLDQLYQLNTRLQSSEAAQRRNFYDRRLGEEKQALSEAEVALKNIQQKTGVIQFSGQAASIINSISQARAQLASREVELQAMRTYATADNPDVMLLEQQIAGLKNNLAQLEHNRETIQPGDVQIPAGQLPEAALQYERQARELKYHETLFDLLTRQTEAARLDESKSAPILQIVDRAIPPDKKSGPSRKLLAIGFTLFGFLIALTWGLLELALDRIDRIPEQASKLQEIKSAFRFR